MKLFETVVWLTLGALSVAGFIIACGDDDDDDNDDDDDDDAAAEQRGQECENLCTNWALCTTSFINTFDSDTECIQECFGDSAEFTDREQCDVDCVTEDGCDAWAQCLQNCAQEFGGDVSKYYPDQK